MTSNQSPVAHHVLFTLAAYGGTTIPNIRREAKLSEVVHDSLDRVEAIMQIEDLTDIQVSDYEWSSNMTVQELITLAETKALGASK